MSKTMKDGKKGLVPALRFPEFRDAEEWELKKLGDEDVAEFVKKRVSRDQLVIDTYVSTENILPDFGGITTASKLPPSGSFTSYKKGDILIANIRPYLKKVWVAKRNGGASNDVVVVRPKEKNDNALLQFILRNEVFIDYVMTGAKGVKMPRGDVALMKEYPLALPSPEEQQKIADCLSSLDALIAAQADKIDALKSYKKGLMQQLFPREGETVPRLRFPEFRDAGEWRQTHIGKICQTYSGGTPSSTNKKYYGGQIPFIRSAEIDKDRTELSLTKEGLQESSAKMARKGDILYALYGANSGEVAIAKIDGAINQAILCLKSEGSNNFIYQFLSFNKNRIIDKYIQGGQGNLSGEIVKSIAVSLPEPNEQIKIADCLSSLDALITAHTEKLEALKSHKKGLMQQLFPSPEVVSA